jgi:hypothetical protein
LLRPGQEEEKEKVRDERVKAHFTNIKRGATTFSRMTYFRMTLVLRVHYDNTYKDFTHKDFTHNKNKWTGVSVLKTFFFVIRTPSKQARLFVPSKYFQLSLIFTCKPKRQL